MTLCAASCGGRVLPLDYGVLGSLERSFFQQVQSSSTGIRSVWSSSAHAGPSAPASTLRAHQDVDHSVGKDEAGGGQGGDVTYFHSIVWVEGPVCEIWSEL